MKIDEKSLRRREVLKVNAVINKYWDSSETEVVQENEDFIQSSWGPDAIELLNGGDEWIVCEREHPNAVFYQDGRTTWVACQELFEMCSRFSPLERIDWHK